MLDIISGSAASSWMLRDRGARMLEREPRVTSAVDIFVKDLGLVTETGLAMKFPLPLAPPAYSMFATASNAGYGQWDDSAVIKVFPGIDLPDSGKH